MGRKVKKNCELVIIKWSDVEHGLAKEARVIHPFVFGPRLAID